MLTCGACEQPVSVTDVRGEFGPSGSWSRCVPNTTTRRRGLDGRSESGMHQDTTMLIGNRWSSALLGAAFLGARRFSEFEARSGAPAAVVADRLRAFCALGVLDKGDDQTYFLTDKGKGFFPAVMSAIAWGQRWFHAPEGPAMVLRHGAHPFTPRLVCGSCAEVLSGADIVVDETATSVQERS